MTTIQEYRELTKGKGKSKYGNQKTEYKGILFDSKKEADYARHLEYLKHAHELKDRVTKVEYQVGYKITINGKYICTYFADFRVTYADLRQEVVDIKGVRTSVFIIKKKLVEASYNIEIIEI